MRYFAVLTPQAWVNGNAIDVDPRGERRWDVTEHLDALSPTDRQRALEPNSDASDRLANSPGAPVWIRSWCGPYRVEVEAEPENDADRVLLAFCFGAEGTAHWKQVEPDGTQHTFERLDGTERIIGSYGVAGACIRHLKPTATELQQRLEQAFHGEGEGSYGAGFKDALRSVVMAMNEYGVTPLTQADTLETCLDGFANNAA